MKTIIERIIREDILNELLKHKNNYDITEKEFIDFCNSRIDIYIDQIVLKNINYSKHYSSRNLHKNKKNMCVARLWLDGYGGQCSHNIIENELCKKHNGMLKKYGNIPINQVKSILKTKNINVNIELDLQIFLI